MCYVPFHISCDSACFFFFNDTATTEIYTLSLHDALPILLRGAVRARPEPDHGRGLRGHRVRGPRAAGPGRGRGRAAAAGDRKSTRLNSSHANISYAVFCLKKKKTLLDFKVTQYARVEQYS